MTEEHLTFPLFSCFLHDQVLSIFISSPDIYSSDRDLFFYTLSQVFAHAKGDWGINRPAVCVCVCVRSGRKF